MDNLLALVRRAFSAVPEAVAFLTDWPDLHPRREVAVGTLPVCDWIGKLQPEAGSAAVVAALQRVVADLAWRQTYTAGDFGADFLRGYGWSEFVGLRGPVPSARIACGVLLLAPGISYPSHAHAAEEG